MLHAFSAKPVLMQPVVHSTRGELVDGRKARLSAGLQVCKATNFCLADIWQMSQGGRVSSLASNQ
jgi:hypothetical protein